MIKYGLNFKAFSFFQLNKINNLQFVNTRLNTGKIRIRKVFKLDRLVIF